MIDKFSFSLGQQYFPRSSRKLSGNLEVRNVFPRCGVREETLLALPSCGDRGYRPIGDFPHLLVSMPEEGW